MIVKLPEPVAAIYRAVMELEAEFPDRKFTPDGYTRSDPVSGFPPRSRRLRCQRT